MTRDAEFYRIAKARWLSLPREPVGIVQARQLATYAVWVHQLSVTFGVVEPVVLPRSLDPMTQNGYDDIRKWAVYIEQYLDKMHARNYFDIENNDDWVELSEDWKHRATTYVAYIRTVVKAAEISEALRERIFARLNMLQQELDRNRTKLEAVTEVWLVTTEAVAKGAKNLEPAVRLIERIGGAFSSVRSDRKGTNEPPLLPAPDSLGLIGSEPH